MRIGIDLGGTKIEGVVLDRRAEILVRERVETPGEGYTSVIAAIVSLVARLEREVGARCPVGIGTPGAASPRTGVLRNSNSVALNGRPFRDDLSTALGREIRMANDANCFALSEAKSGAGTGAHTVLGLIVGTGVGSGIVVGGEILVGRNAIAGEWGHAPLPWPRDDERPGPACYCGRFGCIETWLSGPGLSRDHLAHTGENRTAREIAERASTDPRALASLERHQDRFARALAVVIDVLDPDIVVIGGGLSNLTRLYEVLPEEVARWVFSDAFDTPIVAPKHGDASGVRGAAWLWP